METETLVLKYIGKNPFSTVYEICDNAAKLKLHYTKAKNAVIELIRQNKVGQLLGYYYVTPSMQKEVLFLRKITKLDKILKPKFKKLKYSGFSLDNLSFNQILELYIILFHLKIRIRKIELGINRKSPLPDNELARIQNDLIEYLASFSTSEPISSEKFHNELLRHLDDKYYFSTLHYLEIKTHKIPLKEKLEWLSKWFMSFNMGVIADDYGYETNKFPRKIIQNLFHKNGNPKFELIFEAQKAGEISEEFASELCTQWILRINAKHLKTKEQQRRFRETIRNKYRGWDIFEQGNFRSFDIS